MKKLISLALLAAVLIACQKSEPEKASPAGTPTPAITAAEGVALAKVNNEPITEADVRTEFNMLPFQLQQIFLAQGGMTSLLEEVVKKEMLYQEAKKRNYSQDPKFRSQLENFEKRLMIEFLLEEEIERKSAVTDEDAKKYYDEHIEDFVMEVPGQEKPETLDFETAKELIKQRILAGKQQSVFEDYITSLRETYSVEIDGDAVKAAFGEEPSSHVPALAPPKE